jgi:hypothetical protein
MYLFEYRYPFPQQPAKAKSSGCRKDRNSHLLSIITPDPPVKQRLRMSLARNSKIFAEKRLWHSPDSTDKFILCRVQGIDQKDEEVLVSKTVCLPMRSFDLGWYADFWEQPWLHPGGMVNRLSEQDWRYHPITGFRGGVSDLMDAFNPAPVESEIGFEALHPASRTILSANGKLCSGTGK